MKRAEFYMRPGTHIPSALYGAMLVGVLTRHTADRDRTHRRATEPPASARSRWADVELGVLEARRLLARYGWRTAKRIVARKVEQQAKGSRHGSIGNAEVSGQPPIGSVRAADCCPKGCMRETFEYCAASGTHCDKHCCCPCRLCADERKREDSKKVTT